MWQVYQMFLSTGKCPQDLAAELNLSVNYVHDMLQDAKRIMGLARQFDPHAQNLHREMLKFVPLAASSLETNLKRANPAVTIAFLQGVGALVPKSEISAVSDQERAENLKRSTAAINPRLKRALGIEDGVEVRLADSEQQPEASPAAVLDAAIQENS
jgi:hypothetical protein